MRQRIFRGLFIVSLAVISVGLSPTDGVARDKAPSLNELTKSSASFANLAEVLLPSVVNISSTQKVEEKKQNMPELPQFPQGSPFEDFFEEFMDQRGQGSDRGGLPPALPPTSMGSGFIIDGISSPITMWCVMLKRYA